MKSYTDPIYLLVLAVIAMAIICSSGYAAKTSTSSSVGDSPRPVVTFQKYIWGVSKAAFRVQVFHDRSVIYEGIARVKLKGERRYQLSPGEYQELLRVVHDYATRTTQSDIWHHDAAAVITVPSDGLQRSFSVNIFSGSRHIRFMRNVETLLRVKDLRCGVLVGVNNQIRDVCEVERDAENRWLKGEY